MAANPCFKDTPQQTPEVEPLHRSRPIQLPNLRALPTLKMALSRLALSRLPLSHSGS